MIGYNIDDIGGKDAVQWLLLSLRHSVNTHIYIHFNVLIQHAVGRCRRCKWIWKKFIGLNVGLCYTILLLYDCFWAK